jgi:hypothetical protein
VAVVAGTACPTAARAAQIARQMTAATLPGPLRAAAVLALVVGVIALGVSLATLQAEPTKERPADPAPQIPAKAPPARTPRDLRSVREALVRRNGGNAASEAAVAAGLKWLAAQQAADGHWSMGSTAAGAAPRNDVAATALGLLPFLGAGITHQDKDDPFAANVERGLQYLIQVQDGWPSRYRYDVHPRHRDNGSLQCVWSHG